MASKYDLMVNIGGKLDNSLTKSTTAASKAIGGMQKSANLLKTAIVGAIGYVGISTVVNFGKSCVAAATTAESSMSQLNNVLASTKGASGMTAESATALAASLSGVTTYSKSAVVDTENLLLTFTKIGSGVMPQATEAVLNMSTALGQDTKSGAMQLGKALNDPIAGISKLTEVGVTFTESQKAQITAMQQAGDVAGAQKVMLDELETEFGNSARTAATTTEGRKQQLTNALTSIKASIGGKILPILASVTSAVATHIPQITATVDSIMTHLQPTFDFIKNTIVPGIVNVVSNVLVPAVKGAYTAVKGIVDFISEHAVLFETIAGVILAVVAAMLIWKGVTTAISAVSKAFAAVQLALNVVMAANPVMIIILAIVALVAAFVILWNKCEGFRNFWIGLWDGIKGIVSGIGAWFSTVFTGAWEGIKNAFSSVGSFFSGIWNTITSTFTSIGTTIGNAIGGAFKTVVNAIISFAENTINGFIGAINLAINLINAIPGVNVKYLTPLAIPRLAEGGIVQHGNGGILANIGEGKYDEAVIPLKNGKSLGGSSPIVYSPNIVIQGNASKADVEAATAASFEQFKKFMQKYDSDKKRKCFA